MHGCPAGATGAAPAVSPIRPSLAEQARTAMQAAPILIVESGHTPMGPWAADVHDVDVDGSPVLVAAVGSPLAAVVAAGGPLPVTVHAAMISPVASPDRVRTAVRLAGRLDLVRDADADTILLALARRARPGVVDRLGSGFALLRIPVRDVEVNGRRVHPTAYAAAAPDPLADDQDQIVAELLRRRPGELVRLCGLLHPDLTANAELIAPVGVDRLGLTVQFGSPVDTRFARLDFTDPVGTPAEALRAFASLAQSRALSELGVERRA